MAQGFWLRLFLANILSFLRIMAPSFGMPTLASIISKLEKNDERDIVLDVTKNASVRMKPTSSVRAICDALKKNTVVECVIMRECEVSDAECEAIADMLHTNCTLQELDLQQNLINSPGATIIAKGLRENTGLRELNILNQSCKSFGEETVAAYVSMFDTNTSLVKIKWNAGSTKMCAIDKLLTRNVEIQRRRVGGMEPQPLSKININDTDIKLDVLRTNPETEPEEAEV